MGVNYDLVNADRHERVSFARLPVGKRAELIGNPVSAAIVTAYLLDHLGDRIAFVADIGPSPFNDLSMAAIANFADVTNECIKQLVSDNLLLDIGIRYDSAIDPPDYFRDIRTTWPWPDSPAQ